MTNHDPSLAADRTFDHLDDQGQHSTAEIREITGYETDGSNEDFTVDAITARAGGQIALQGMGEQFWQEQNQKGGFNHAALVNNDPGQKVINQAGRDKLRAEIARAKQGK